MMDHAPQGMSDAFGGVEFFVSNSVCENMNRNPAPLPVLDFSSHVHCDSPFGTRLNTLTSCGTVGRFRSAVHAVKEMDRSAASRSAARAGPSPVKSVLTKRRVAASS